MKKLILSFLICITSSVYAELYIPASLEKSIKTYIDKSKPISIYRIDIVVIENLKISESDAEETWYDLKEWEFSENLVELPKEPSLLVKKTSIKHGLKETPTLIKKVEFSNKENQEEVLVKNPKKEKNRLPVELFEKVEDQKLTQIYKDINKNSNYKVLYQRSWYQPIFNKELSFPVLILGNKLDKVVYGELITYKERYLHSDIKLRFSPKNSDLDYIPEIDYLYKFNDLENIFKENNKLKKDSYFWQESFLPKIKISFMDIKKWFNYLPLIPNEITIKEEVINTSSKSIPEIQLLPENQYELIEERKMEEGKLHYIDHPYFGVLIQISPWDAIDIKEGP